VLLKGKAIPRGIDVERGISLEQDIQLAGSPTTIGSNFSNVFFSTTDNVSNSYSLNDAINLKQ